jgi:hypothetical protein
MKKPVGIIAVTAGVPLAVLAIAAPTAWAAPSGNGASVSINGTPHGSPNATFPTVADSTQSTGPQPNIAVAVNGSFAAAVGAPSSGNKAIAVNGSHAQTATGDSSNNSAIAINGSTAVAGAVTSGSDSNNTARAVCGGHATATGGVTKTNNGGACGK